MVLHRSPNSRAKRMEKADKNKRVGQRTVATPTRLRLKSKRRSFRERLIIEIDCFYIGLSYGVVEGRNLFLENGFETIQLFINLPRQIIVGLIR